MAFECDVNHPIVHINLHKHMNVFLEFSNYDLGKQNKRMIKSKMYYTIRKGAPLFSKFFLLLILFNYPENPLVKE
jgi:hypothetical protein